jgi:hypothetical protein
MRTCNYASTISACQYRYLVFQCYSLFPLLSHGPERRNSLCASGVIGLARYMFSWRPALSNLDYEISQFQEPAQAEVRSAFGKVDERIWWLNVRPRRRKRYQPPLLVVKIDTILAPAATISNERKLTP